MGRKFIIAGLILSCIMSIAIWQRHRILLSIVTSGVEVPQREIANLPPSGRTIGNDKHFSVVQLDDMTYAIAEPFSWARNVNYLIIGKRRALLFDAGVGHYDIRPIVESLTSLPVTFMPSHFHYDHTGQGAWSSIAIVDLPHIRERARGNLLQPTWGEHLGDGEGIELPMWEVTQWVKPNSTIDLGGRNLVLIYTPGHTDNSVSLLDVERELMFTGDFISDGGMLNAVFPGANLGDYLQSSNKVLRRTTNMQRTIFRGAHASAANTIPANSRKDLQTLRDKLIEIREGRHLGVGGYPVVYTISDSMSLSAEPSIFQDWMPTYPDDHDVN